MTETSTTGNDVMNLSSSRHHAYHGPAGSLSPATSSEPETTDERRDTAFADRDDLHHSAHQLVSYCDHVSCGAYSTLARSLPIVRRPSLNWSRNEVGADGR